MKKAKSRAKSKAKKDDVIEEQEEEELAPVKGEDSEMRVRECNVCLESTGELIEIPCCKNFFHMDCLRMLRENAIKSGVGLMEEYEGSAKGLGKGARGHPLAARGAHAAGGQTEVGSILDTLKISHMMPFFPWLKDNSKEMIQVLLPVAWSEDLNPGQVA